MPHLVQAARGHHRCSNKTWGTQAHSGTSDCAASWCISALMYGNKFWIRTRLSNLESDLEEKMSQHHSYITTVIE